MLTFSSVLIPKISKNSTITLILVLSKLDQSIFDNDFLHMLKNFNVSSDLDLEYYCYFKGKGACKMPATKNVEELWGISKWWPEKKPEHYSEPKYKTIVKCLMFSISLTFIFN